MLKKYVFLFIIIYTVTNAQLSSPTYRRIGILNANNIKTVINNYGVLGQPSNQYPMVSWKYDHNGYFGDLSFLIGVELPIKDYNGDGNLDTLHEVIITPVNRPGGGNSNAINGQFGGFEPDTGYYNPNLNVQGEGVAISTLPETWPSSWGDHPEYGQNAWDGFFGKDSSAGDEEAYFQIDDREDATYYKQYKFLPDPSDTTRYGFGITVNVRYIELKNPLFEDVLFRVYDIKNESKFNYSKIIFGNLAGTYIGGAGDEYNDDDVYFDSTNNVIYAWDKEPGLGIPYVRPEANPLWLPNPYAVGTTGESFLQSPNNNKMGGFDYYTPAGAINMANSSDMWARMTTFSSVDTLTGRDGDYIYSSNIFSLNSGETKRIATVLAFGNDKVDVLAKIQLARILWYNNFGLNIYNQISFSEPVIHKTLSGIETIKWTSKNSGGTVDIWYSPDAGSSWINIIRNTPNSGSYSWNTASYQDCSFGQLKIFINDNNGNTYGLNLSNYFTINNPGNGSPFVKILNTEFDSSQIITDNSHNFNLLIGDPENDQLTCNVYYSTLDDTNYYFSQTFSVSSDTSAQTLPIDFMNMPNSQQLRIKLEVSDGSLSYSAVTPYFNKQTPRQILGTSNYNKLSGYAQVKIEIRKAEPSHITGDNYQITFDDTSSQSKKTFNVYDLTKNNYVLKNAPLIPYSESPVFGGLTLYTEDTTNTIDSALSRWSHKDANNLNYSLLQLNYPSLNIISKRYPFNYMFVFSDSYSDSSYSLYKAFGKNALPNKTVNFKVYDITNKNMPEQVQFGFENAIPSRGDSLSNLNYVFLSNHDGTSISWEVLFSGSSTSNVPHGGDTLYLYTTKGISYFDTLEIFDLPSDVKQTNQVPLSYNLAQNYPNPFNPTTIINYSVPKAGLVLIKVYDILGREVTQLVNEQKNAGTYNIEFNASKLATGVYFYRMQAGNFVETKKLLLLK